VLAVERYARGAGTRRKLAELRFLLADVNDVAPAALPWSAVRIDRGSRRWRSLFELARLLLGRHWQQTHAQKGQPDGITLLFPMNELFERYIAVQLKRALAGTGLEVISQGGGERCLGPWREGENCVGATHSTFPDILIRKGGRTVAVIDTKWKLRSKGIAQGDVYQMMAYARLYRCDRLMLLYPAVPGEVATDINPHGLSQGPERLDIASVQLAEPGLEAMRLLGAYIVPIVA
jgi:5-methylcytosine-specific restriction enzyme subunit McrC